MIHLLRHSLIQPPICFFTHSLTRSYNTHSRFEHFLMRLLIAPSLIHSMFAQAITRQGYQSTGGMPQSGCKTNLQDVVRGSCQVNISQNTFKADHHLALPGHVKHSSSNCSKEALHTEYISRKTVSRRDSTPRANIPTRPDP